MKNEYIYGVLGILGGFVLALIFSTSIVNSNNTKMMKMMDMNAVKNNQDNPDMPTNQHMMTSGNMMQGDDNSMSMSDMVEGLKGKSGDNFDKAFIEEMIPHHQGAIDMAELVEENAKHQEIKDLAKEIIEAQANEIKLMREWQATWGY